MNDEPDTTELAMMVLVAEDDPVSQRILRNYLEKWGYEFQMVGDGARAWELFQQQDFPIVISDWLMPEMDGVDLIRRIRDRDCEGRTVYAILLTAKSQKEDLVEAMEAGADDFLTKPFDRDELRIRLREGERIVRLERAVAEQSRQLRQVQHRLDESDQRPRWTEQAVEIRKQALALLDDAIRNTASTSQQPGSAADPAAMRQALIQAHEKLKEIRGLIQKLRAGEPATSEEA